MYSKYLNYTEGAQREHEYAMAENEQKDSLIAHLKAERHSLKNLDGDFLRLNAAVRDLEDKFQLLSDEKERSQKEYRNKNDIDSNTIIALKQEIDLFKVKLHKATISIDDLIRENTAMKRMCDTRTGEVHALLQDIKNAQNKNARSSEENAGLSVTVRGLKEQRKKLQEELDSLSALLDANIGKLKILQKNVRNQQSVNARLNKSLNQAENDSQKLIAELKSKNEEAKRIQNKLKTMKNTLSELKMSYTNLQQQNNKNQVESGTHAGNLSKQTAKGRQLLEKMKRMEANILEQERELDLIIEEEQKLRRFHFDGLDHNKYLNGELDRILALIGEYEQINKELVDQIEIYIDQDEQARTILNRREKMRELINGTLRKVAVTGDPIRHIKY